MIVDCSLHYTFIIHFFLSSQANSSQPEQQKRINQATQEENDVVVNINMRMLLRTALRQAKSLSILLAYLLIFCVVQVLLSLSLPSSSTTPRIVDWNDVYQLITQPTIYTASTSSSCSTISPPPRTKTPLPILAGSYKEPVQCPDGLIYVNDTILDPDTVWSRDNRKIPRIIHVTSKSRCMTPEFANNLNLWRLPDYSLFLHDDTAVMELFHRYWPEFPQFQQLRRCLVYPRGAVLADIWRLLILWEYGGIYTDIDTAPNQFNSTTIEPDDDAFFVLEVNTLPSQWFMAVSPGHPLIYFAMQSILENLQYKMLQDTGNFRIVWTTGPGVIGQGFAIFARTGGESPTAGYYVGTDNRSVRLVGNSSDQDEYVVRVNIRDKEDKYEFMNMTHILRMGLEETHYTNRSCLETLYEYDKQYVLQSLSSTSSPSDNSNKKSSYW